MIFLFNYEQGKTSIYFLLYKLNKGVHISCFNSKQVDDINSSKPNFLFSIKKALLAQKRLHYFYE